MLIYIVLISIILLLLFYIYKFNRSIESVSEQIDYLLKNDSRIRLTNELSNRELEELIDKINQYSDALKALRLELNKEESRSKDIIIGLSHDIRTPLTSLGAYIDLLSREEDPDKRDQYIEVIEKRIESLNRILEELFTYAKLEKNVIEFELEKLDLTEELSQALFSFYEDFKKKDIRPEIEIPDRPIYIKGQKDALNRVILNILKNALDHGKTKIIVKLEEVNDMVHIEISNEVDDNYEIDMDNIFNQFYKADSSRKNSSTGLGLYIAKRMTELQNGKMEAFREANEFIIRIEFEKWKHVK